MRFRSRHASQNSETLLRSDTVSTSGTAVDNWCFWKKFPQHPDKCFKNVTVAVAKEE